MIGKIDPREIELAKMLLTHSTKAKSGESIYIECVGEDTLTLGAALVEECAKIGAAPYLHYTDPSIQAKYIQNADKASMKRLGEFELAQMKNTDCYIGIRGSENIFEHAGIPVEQQQMFTEYIRTPVHLKERVTNTRWTVMRYPGPSMAQLSLMSTPDFEDFYYSVCLVDYNKMAKAVDPLAKLMEATDKVRIKGPGETDFSLSIKDIPVIPCTGERNVPDGECFTAPVRDSINGIVQYNTPTVYEGHAFDNIRIEFENGKAVNASAANDGQTNQLNKILDRDEGSRYIGEFAIAFNPIIKEPMRDILFDEKIGGSFHMAFGKAYDMASNGNESAIHWDCICIQREEYGGGEIYFDDKLIRKDGLFVIDELKGLNPDAFK